MLRRCCAHYSHRFHRKSKPQPRTNGFTGFFRGVSVVATAVLATGYRLFKQGESQPSSTEGHDLRVCLRPQIGSEQQEAQNSGSGVVWDQDHVVTCCHVTQGRRFMVASKDDQEYLLAVVAESPQDDVALLKTVDGQTLSCTTPFSARPVYQSPVVDLAEKRYRLLGNGQIAPLSRVDFARISLATPHHVITIGRLASEPGFSGGAVLSDTGKAVGIYRFGGYFAGSFQWLGGYIRADHLKVVVDRMLNDDNNTTLPDGGDK